MSYILYRIAEIINFFSHISTLFFKCLNELILYHCRIKLLIQITSKTELATFTKVQATILTSERSHHGIFIEWGGWKLSESREI
jgi:hypothetical protein